MRVRILGKVWELRFCYLKFVSGYCEAPTKPRKRILIDKRLEGEHELEVIIHELRHAADWGKDEIYIAEEAADIARVLWRLGYRRTEKTNHA